MREMAGLSGYQGNAAPAARGRPRSWTRGALQEGCFPGSRPQGAPVTISGKTKVAGDVASLSHSHQIIQGPWKLSCVAYTMFSRILLAGVQCCK
jgi:hypothetical protein